LKNTKQNNVIKQRSELLQTITILMITSIVCMIGLKMTFSRVCHFTVFCFIVTLKAIMAHRLFEK